MPTTYTHTSSPTLSIPQVYANRSRLIKKGYGNHFEVVSVSIEDGVDQAPRFLKMNPVSYTVLDDPIGIATRNFALWRLPATFLVKPNGEIDQIYYGFGDTFAGDIESRVLALLQGRYPPSPVWAPARPAKAR